MTAYAAWFRRRGVRERIRHGSGRRAHGRRVGLPPRSQEAAARMSDPRIVIITGASSGMGRATAHLLAEAGDHLMLAARGTERLESCVSECLSRGAASAAWRSLDVADRAAVEALVTDVAARFGRVDAVVNSA